MECKNHSWEPVSNGIGFHDECASCGCKGYLDMKSGTIKPDRWPILISSKKQGRLNMSKPLKPKSASDIVEVIKKNEEKNREETYKSLREKFIKEVNEMISFGEYVTEVDIQEGESDVLEKVTEELRELGYKFSLIERQSSDKKTTDLFMRVSVAHLKGE